MRAKFLLLAEKPAYREGLRWAQELLSELAVAFSHSFLMREDILQDRQPELAALALEHEVILLAGSRSSAETCAESLGCFAGLTRLNLSEASGELSRLKEGKAPAADLFWPLTGDNPIISKLAVAVCAHAKREGKPIILCQDESRGDWEAIFGKAAMYAALPVPDSLPFEQTLDRILFHPQQQALVVAPPGQSAMLRSLLCYLGGAEHLQHTVYLSDHRPLFHVTPVTDQQGLPLFALLYAAKDAVKFALGLNREADCLETAIDNVLQSGWRTSEFGLLPKTIAHEEAIRLMVEQVQLAGELMERFH